jgi:carbamoyltransferase
MAHAASTFFTSPFEKASVFTADASIFDDYSCSGYFVGEKHKLGYFRNPGYTWGNFYDVATELCGLGPGTLKAGTLMGLSSYGRVSKKAIDNWEFWTRPQVQRKDTEDIYYSDWLFLQISGKFPFVGALREDIQNNVPGSWQYTREFQEVYPKEMADSKEVMDIAADVQYVTERSLVKYSQDLYDESHVINDGNLCLAGGTFLNCNANYKVATETSFENVHFFPACGDDGVTVGSSLFFLHTMNEYPRVEYKPKELMYLGFEYDYQPESKYTPIDLDLRFVAEQIADGKIICWYQGRSEFGPRALGNRSFISDPRRVEMKDILNSRVKFREWFRPFAPVVLKEYRDEWFDMDFDSPFMLHTVPCKRPTEIPSAVHIDNTSRVQTIDKPDNQKFYDLIYNFFELTGVPVVMNTSLNVKGEPIVETPEDVMKLFEESDVDVLVINDKVYLKN